MITARDELLHNIELSGLEDAKRVLLRRLVRRMTHPELDGLCELLDWLDSEHKAETTP
jgi:hypothetical protein